MPSRGSFIRQTSLKFIVSADSPRFLLHVTLPLSLVCTNKAKQTHTHTFTRTQFSKMTSWSCTLFEVAPDRVRKRGTKHLCIRLCGWNPAAGRLSFSEVCRDLTGPVTGGTVNIRLSCDSHCGLKEAVKGQCFLMPLPTTKLSDFISLLIRLSYFRGWIHWRCCITHVHARRVIIHISFKEHATSTDQTRACTFTCACAPGFVT